MAQKPLQVWIHVIIPALKPIIEFVGVVTTIGALTSMFGLIMCSPPAAPARRPRCRNS